MHRQATCDYCRQSYMARQKDQRFCSPSHNTMFYQNKKNERLEATIIAQQASSAELDQLKQENDSLRIENERLKKENDMWKESVKKHHDQIDNKDEEIDNWKDLVRIRDKEIERLKFDANLLGKNAIEIRKLAALQVKSQIHKQYDEHIKKTFREYTPANVEAIRTFGTRFFHDVGQSL
jgi:hypothetical protein